MTTTSISANRRMLRRQTLYKATALFFAVYVIGMLIHASMQSDTFRIEHSIVINVPAEKVFGLLDNFHNGAVWSPWEMNDPVITRQYSVADYGLGAVYTWQTGNSDSHGRMEISASEPAATVVIRLDMYQPYNSHNTVAFTLVKQASGTLLTQAVYGPRPYLSKLLSLAFDLDKMLGDKYASGLARLKVAAEQ